MNILISILFIIITILSIIIFKIKGLLILIITLPLYIIYLNSDKIINFIKRKKEGNKKNDLLERKEVEFVSSSSRKRGTIKEEKKKKIKPQSKNNKNKSRNKKEKTKKKGLVRKILIFILGFAIFCIFAFAAFMIYIVVSTSSFDPNALVNQDQTILYDKNGEEFATLGVQKRESVTYDVLPQVLVDAIIATEDSRFYQHNGVDMARFIKATALNLIGRDEAGGASTLTMQTVKNNLTKKGATETSKIQKIIRKFQDVYLSVFFMEKKYSKEQILEFYVNDSYLGGGVYGVQEASRYYFGKDVSELSLPEASLIAGMYQAPSSYDPYNHPDRAEERRNTVLTLMVRHGYITEEEKEMAQSVKVESMLVGAKADTDYQGYVDTVIEEVIELTGDNPSLVSMKIYTALDRDIQDGINDVLNGTSYTGWVDDEIQAGIAVTNVNDGTIVAVGAGRNRKGERVFNYATQAVRQPGSTAKPLFDYGPGFEYNDFSTYTLFNDEPWTYTNGPSVGNWDSRYNGLITLKQALGVSRNVPALKAFQQIDKKNIAKFVSSLGIEIAYSTSSDNYKEYANGGNNLLNEAYSIGGMSYGVTPLDMAEAYAAFANGGYHIESHAVTKIEYRDSDKVIITSDLDKYQKEKVMSDSTAYLMNNALQYAVEYAFDGGARVYGSTVAAKTGTSNISAADCKKLGIPVGSVADLWTVAYTPEYSVALWYGYEESNSSHYLTGASAPKDNIMRAVIKTIPKTTKKWEMPSSVVAVTVEKETWPAQLPSEYTPDNMKITEYFKKGTQPTEVSQRYAKLPAVTNLQSTKEGNNYKLTWNFKTPDVLDSAYLSKYFSNSVYGNQSANYLQARLNYNNNTLGGFGFGIYKKTSSGNLELIDFISSTSTEYTYKPTDNGSVDIIVRAEYKNFKDNASDETKITLKVDNIDNDKELELTLKGNSELSVTKGNYKESGIIVKYNNIDVTVLSKITYTYTLNNKIYTKEDELVTEINKLEAGKEIEITYSVTYKKQTKQVTRKVKIIEG